jgi:hypothetical protein
MCPDRQILSVYADGELPSPWKEKLESHLAQCPECGKLLETYRLFSAAGAALNEEEAAAKKRVWQRLESVSGRAFHSFSAHGLWRRSLSIPLPAAAVAAAALFIAFALLWMRKPVQSPPSSPETILASEEIDSPDIVPVSNMNDVLQYLGSRDSGDILILRLPENSNFSSSGEPAIIRAADYSRRKY